MCIKGLSFVGLIILLSLFNCESSEVGSSDNGVRKTVLPTKIQPKKSKKSKKSKKRKAGKSIGYIKDLKTQLSLDDKTIKQIQKITNAYKDNLQKLSSTGKLSDKKRKTIIAKRENEIEKILGPVKYLKYNKFNTQRMLKK